MEIVKSDEYDEMAATYQCLEIDRLNAALKKHGMEDAQAREAVCQDYFFCSGHFLDAGWFRSEGRTLWPELGFAERPRDPKAGHLGEIETLHLAERFSFHEYAGGDVFWYFTEHGEDASEIESGTV